MQLRHNRDDEALRSDEDAPHPQPDAVDDRDGRHGTEARDMADGDEAPLRDATLHNGAPRDGAMRDGAMREETGEPDGGRDDLTPGDGTELPADHDPLAGHDRDADSTTPDGQLPGDHDGTLNDSADDRADRDLNGATDMHDDEKRHSMLPDGDGPGDGADRAVGRARPYGDSLAPDADPAADDMVGAHDGTPGSDADDHGMISDHTLPGEHGAPGEQHRPVDHDAALQPDGDHDSALRPDHDNRDEDGYDSALRADHDATAPLGMTAPHDGTAPHDSTAPLGMAENGDDDAATAVGQGSADGGPDRPTELMPGAATAAPVDALWPEGAAQGFRDRWREVQVQFLDDPKAAAHAAEELIGEVVDSLTGALNQQREQLRGWQSSDRHDTEELRMTVRRYREAMNRLLDL